MLLDLRLSARAVASCWPTIIVTPRTRHIHPTLHTTLAATKQLSSRKRPAFAGFFIADTKGISVRLSLDRSVYSLEAVQKAAYRFIDRLTILISQSEEIIFCEIDVIVGQDNYFEPILADFKRELLDQQLRLKIKNETTDVRNLILSYAFSRSGLQG
jgi:His-Xaa-Ser system protein HxsD